MGEIIYHLLGLHVVPVPGFDFEKWDVQLRCFSISSLLLSLRSGFSGFEFLSNLVATTQFTLDSEMDEERYLKESLEPLVVTPFRMAVGLGNADPFSCSKQYKQKISLE